MSAAPPASQPAPVQWEAVGTYRDIRFLRGVDAEIPVILASNDNALCGQARRIGAVTIAATDIGALL